MHGLVSWPIREEKRDYGKFDKLNVQQMFLVGFGQLVYLQKATKSPANQRHCQICVSFIPVFIQDICSFPIRSHGAPFSHSKKGRRNLYYSSFSFPYSSPSLQKRNIMTVVCLCISGEGGGSLSILCMQTFLFPEKKCLFFPHKKGGEGDFFFLHTHMGKKRKNRREYMGKCRISCAPNKLAEFKKGFFLVLRLCSFFFFFSGKRKEAIAAN